MKIKFTKRQIKLLLVFVILVFVTAVGSSTFAAKFNRYALDQQLSALALQPSDFPEDAESYEAGIIVAENISHPLNSEMSWVKSQPALSEYIAGYSSGGIVPSGSGAVMVGSFVYQYPSAAQVKEAETILITNVINEGGVVVSTSLSSKETAVSDHSFFVPDPAIADRSTYWLVTTKENVLMLLVVDGLSEPQTVIQETFKNYVEKLLQ